MIVDANEFENEVREVARHLWPEAAFSGATKMGESERDGVFITDEAVHLIECTVSRRKDKAEQDARKLIKLVESMQSQYPTKAAKGYFVTLEEPTAEQRDAVKRIAGDRVASLSFAQLRRFMIDASSYLAARIEYPFGSMYDIETESYTAPSGLITPELTTSDGEVLRIIDVRRMLEEGQSIVFGGRLWGWEKHHIEGAVCGVKGSLLHEPSAGTIPRSSQPEGSSRSNHPAEALERHARNIGFPSPHHLVRAWNAGYLTLLLDGFDEFATVGWSGQAKRLRAIRYESMELIRNFMRGSANAGIIIAGREHYFDSARELSSSLGLRSNAKRLYISDFTDAQIREFLAKKGWTEGIPDWLPSRPLLLSYLFARRMLEQVMAVDYGINPAAGWDVFLEPVYDLFRINTMKASTTICRLVLSFLSQFFQSRRHFSSQAKDRSTTHRFDSTTKVCNSLRFTTSTEAPNRPCTAVAKGSPV